MHLSEVNKEIVFNILWQTTKPNNDDATQRSTDQKQFRWISSADQLVISR